MKTSYLYFLRVPHPGARLGPGAVGSAPPTPVLLIYEGGSAQAGYNRFNVFLQTFKTANNLKFEDEDIDNRYYCFLVFVYDINLPHKDPVIYSSINKALKGLKLSYSTLLDYINNFYVYKSNFILSFEPIAADKFKNYTVKPVYDNQVRKHIII